MELEITTAASRIIRIIGCVLLFLAFHITGLQAQSIDPQPGALHAAASNVRISPVKIVVVLQSRTALYTPESGWSITASTGNHCIGSSQDAIETERNIPHATASADSPESSAGHLLCGM